MDNSIPRPDPPASRRRRVLALALLAAALAGSGCSIPGTLQDPFEDRASGQIRLRVINLDFNDATLFALRGAQRIRLGVVSGKGEASYVIPWPSMQTLQVQISLFTQGSCTTNAVQVDPGESLELQIQVERMRGGQCVDLRGG